MTKDSHAWTWLVVGVALVGCSEPEVISSESMAPPVMLTRVEAHHIVDRIEATGQLLAKAEAVIAAEVGGRVTEINAEEGSAVEADQVIVRIDPQRRQLELRTQRAQLAETEAALAEAKREAQRIEKLRKRNAVSESRLDQARTELRRARSRLDAPGARLGVYRDGMVEIAKGLDPGDKLVIRGQADLVNGSMISVRNQDGSLVEFGELDPALARREPEAVAE